MTLARPVLVLALGLSLLPACSGGDAGESCELPARDPAFTGVCAELNVACGSRFTVNWASPIDGSYRVAVDLGDRRVEATCPGETDAACDVTLACDAAGFVLATPSSDQTGVLAAHADEPLYWELHWSGGTAAGTVPSAGTEIEARNGPGC